MKFRMMKTMMQPVQLFGLMTLLSLLFLVPGLAQAALPEGFTTEVVAEGLFLPTTFDFAPDGRIFVAEKNGTVRVIKNGELLAEPFLTLDTINTWVDRGLIGLAVHPNFAETGWIYLSYTYENSPNDFDGPKMAQVVRVQATGDVADLATWEVILGTEVGDASSPSCNDFPAGTDCIPSDSGSHSAGGLRFGPDGKLYATLGDGAGFTGVDPNARKAQDLDWLTGKLLRLNDDGTAPSDNPFYTGDATDNRSKVFAYGIRNSFRFDFRPDTGVPYLGEVGWGAWEEINVATPGANFGWPCREGLNPQDSYNCVAENYTDPIYSYAPDGNTVAVVGGTFPGAAYPAEYRDDYFFADFQTSNIYRMTVTEDNEFVARDTWLAGSANGPVALLRGPDGSLYFTAIFTGQLIKIVYETDETEPAPPIARDDSVTVLNDETIEIFVLDNDSDANDDPLQLTSVSDPAHGSIVITADQSIRYTPDAGYVGEDTFVYIVSDGDLADDALVTVDVRQSGDPAGVELVHIGSTRNITDPVVGELTTFTATVRNDGTSGPILVDFELYDAVTGDRVDADFFPNEFIAAGETETYTYEWLPERSGDYWLSVGYFYPDWQALHAWIDVAEAFSVLDRQPPTDDPFVLAVRSIDVSDPLLAVGESTTLTAEFTNTGQAGSGLVHIGIYDPNGVLIDETNVNDVEFDAGEIKTFTMNWTPTESGQYWVDLGAFGADWSPFFDWMWRGVEIVVTENGVDPPATDDVVIYDDQLSSDFYNWSWGTETTPNATTEVFTGNSSLSAEVTDAYGAVYFRAATPIAAADVSQLNLALHGGAVGGQSLFIKVVSDTGVLYETTVTDLSTDWNELTLSLDAIAADAQIAGIMIQDGTGAAQPVFYVDSVSFTRN